MIKAIILFVVFVIIAAMAVLGLINLAYSNSMDSSDYTFVIVVCFVIGTLVTIPRVTTTPRSIPKDYE